MRDYFKPKTWLITILMFIIAFGLSSAIVYYEFGFGKNIKISNADAGNNVSGFAWNSNIGWISFNCTDSTCDKDYGVKIDPVTGNFSGYAWSSSVGWISFNRSDTGNPPSDPYKDDSGPIAKYDSVSGKVYGWARILSYKPSGTDNNNGWIKLRDSNYGVSIISQSPTALNLTAPNWDYPNASSLGALNAKLGWEFSSSDGVTKSQFSGWAWNANSDGSGIGWISFNCADNNSCGASNYKVLGPSITSETLQKAYQIIVNTENSTSSPIFDSGKCLGRQSCEPEPTCDLTKCSVDNGADGTTLFWLGRNDLKYNTSVLYNAPLKYDTSYYWWVKIWDDNGAESGWVQYNTNPDTPQDADDGKLLTFTTYKHEFPRASSTWFIVNPSRAEQVKFIDTSERYFSDAPTTTVPCTSDTCIWEWSVPENSGAKINDRATSTPIIIFGHKVGNTVTLKVTDKGDDTGDPAYWSKIEISIDVNEMLPRWKEVKPE